MPSSSVVVTVPEPKAMPKKPWQSIQKQIIQTPDPPILGIPGEKEKLPEMMPLHSQHPLREEQNADKNRFWRAFLKLDAKRVEMEKDGLWTENIERWFDTHAGQDIFGMIKMSWQRFLNIHYYHYLSVFYV